MALSRRSLLQGLGVTGAVGGAGVLATAGFGTGRSSPAPSVLVAGSLLELATAVGGASVEAHGSVAVRRLVVDGLRDPDALAVADPGLLRGLVDRATLFATNALVLTYDPASPLVGALQADWREALADPDLRLGRTDPRKDPLGYRTVMALRLADRRDGLDADAVLDRSGVFLETDLLNVLEGGSLDAAFTYRNMAVQRDLPHVALPDAIDFSDPALADHYRTVDVDLGDRTVRGAPIRYAATALAETGEPWTERLVTAARALREAGFGVPDGYPRRDRPVSTLA